jgi:hypothetical protein
LFLEEEIELLAERTFAGGEQVTVTREVGVESGYFLADIEPIGVMSWSRSPYPRRLVLRSLGDLSFWLYVKALIYGIQIKKNIML